MTRRFVFATLLIAVPLAGSLVVHAQSASGLRLDAIDRAADPGNDLYQFACGAWIAKNPIPPDRSSWASPRN